MGIYLLFAVISVNFRLFEPDFDVYGTGLDEIMPRLD
jgi:hypothetical protein